MSCDVGRSDRSDRKIERWSFLWCCYNNARGEIFVYYEKKKGIRRVVIMIQKLEITGGLLHDKIVSKTQLIENKEATLLAQLNR